MPKADLQKVSKKCPKSVRCLSRKCPESVPKVSPKWPRSDWEVCGRVSGKCPKTVWKVTEKRRSTVDRWPLTVDRRPSTVDRRPSTVDRRPSTVCVKKGTKFVFARTDKNCFWRRAAVLIISPGSDSGRGEGGLCLPAFEDYTYITFHMHFDII